MRKRTTIIAMILFAAPMPGRGAALAPVHLVRVIDGDTIVVEDTGGLRRHVRLADIDAPEHDQPFGAEAK